MPASEKILVAMSGGVDSSVAALLLKQQGHNVVGAYMKNWINEDRVIGHCPWEEDIVDARRVAEQIGIEFRVVNLMREYRDRVVDYLLDGYARGLTPNPDIMCNREIKFGVFRAWAKENGFTAVATGHYAQRVEVKPAVAGGLGDAAPAALGRGHSVGAQSCCAQHQSRSRAQQDCAPTAPSSAAESAISDGSVTAARLTQSRNARANRPGEPLPDTGSAGRLALPACHLLEGADANKDQSYFLALLSQEQLRDARFPIGHLTKPELRAIARSAGLATADKKDSQGICFIGEVKMQDFLRAYVPDAPGPIVRATDGRELGRHRGLHFYTLGQRKGIGIPSNTDHEAYVVVGKRAADRALLVAFDHPDAPGLFQREVRVHSLSWVGEPILAPRSLEARVRYRDPRVPIEFIPESGGVSPAPAELADGTPALSGTALVRFHHAQRGLASGQILAIYDGPRLLGGGVYV